MNRKLTAALLAFAIFAFAALLSQSAAAQTKVVPSLITQAVDETQLSTLHGNTYPLARAEFDKGAAPPDLPMARMMLVLKRSPEQQAALSALMNEQQDKSSPNYHNWLTPVDFGKQFGPSDQDIQTVVSWLGSHGFLVAKVSNGRTIIEFSGTASQVKEAFRTEIHKFAVNGEEHWANSRDPQIPSALAPIVAGPLTLHNFPRKSMMQVVGPFTRTKATGKVRPDTTAKFTFAGGICPSVCFGVAPPDFAKIYNVGPLYTANIDGTGQTIAIVAQSNINPADIAQFRTLFGLPPNQPNVILNGPDPGLQGAETEADLDVEWAGAVAKGATIDLVVSESTETSLGADLSAQFIVDNNLAPVLNESFGICELGLGDAGNQFYNSLWEQAAAQGISVFVSSGDNGSAGCSDHGAPPPHTDTFGIQVSGFASTPFNVAVGGTDFNQAGTTAANQPSNFWNTTPSDTPTVASAKGYIPETTWNDTCTNGILSAQVFGGSPDPEVNCNNSGFAGAVNTVGGSGGPSNCTSSDGQTPSSCQGGYAKPTWQAGPGVPADGKRDIPDVSLFASGGFFTLSFYIICEQDFNPAATSCDPNQTQTDFVGVGGTSASSPSFAGIMAMVVQKTGSRQGNPNFVLYPLAAKAGNSCPSSASPASSCIFNDIPPGTTNAMPCASGSTPACIPKHSGDAIAILPGFATTAGYDEATGLGSVNATNLVNHWNDVATTLKGSITTFGLPTSSPVTITHGQSVNVSATVVAQTSSGIPTGSVALETSNNQGVGAFQLSAAGLFAAVSGSTTNLPGGTYTVTARYSGDGVFAPSTSGAVNVTVSPENSQTQEMVELFNPFTGQITNPNATNFTFGTPQLLRVNVASTSATASCAQNKAGSLGCPTGTITLTDSGTPLDGGSFTLNVLGYTEDQLLDLPAGSHSITASYSGDASFQPSSAAADNITVTQAPTTVMVATMLPSIPSGSPLTIQATVATQSFGTPPTGTVTFFSGSSTLGAVAVTGGVNQMNSTSGATATFTTAPNQLANGQDSITAQYKGDNNYSGSPMSPAVVVTVGTPPGVSISASPTKVTVSSPGSSGTTALTFTATNGFTGTINLSPSSCTMLPSGASCSFSPASVTLTSTTTTATANLSVATMAPSSVVPLLKAPPSMPTGWVGTSTFFMAMLILLSLKAASRKRWGTTLALLFLGSVAGLVACSGGSSKPTNPGTPAGTSTFNVTVSTGTGSSQTVQITLVVK
jgi:hypothetical protein